MQAKITSQLLRSILAGGKPFEINDVELRGFLVRVQPTGAKTFICSYRLRRSGRRNRYTIGRFPTLTVSQARSEAHKILGDVAKGNDPTTARRVQRRVARSPTLRTFLAGEYAHWGRTHFSNPTATIARISAAFSDILDKRLIELNPWLLDGWKSRRLRSGLRPATVNRELAALRAALSKAVEWEIVAANPMDKLKLAKQEKDLRARFLNNEEEQRLRKALDAREESARSRRDRYNAWLAQRALPQIASLRKQTFCDHIKPMVLITLNTGMRRGEMFHLRRSDVDLPNRQLKIRGAHAKGRQSRFLPLNDEAMGVLAAWLADNPSGPESLLFPGKEGAVMNNIKHAWESLAKDAKLIDFRWHDLRHHFASRLVMLGVDLNTVRELLGHADLKMTLRYAHLAPEHKAHAVAKLLRAA